MSAREKITNLTMLWIFYGAATSALSVLTSGFGFWSFVTSGIGLLIGIAINVAIGKALMNRNNIVRWVVAIVAAGMLGLGVMALGKLGLLFIGTWSFRLLIPAAMLVPMLAMEVHSLRVLFSSEVRSHFR